jgi:glycosyltransferase involved in cell wall biosynthesis
VTLGTAATPLISVVIPTHNRAEMLAEALASVQAQTFKDYEIIVVSNGESDDMRRSSRAIVAAHDGRYFALAEGNASAARNFGIEQARGQWIAFLDDDDLWLPHKLERQIAEAMKTGADLISCDFVRFFADGTEAVDRLRPPAGWTHAKALNHQLWWSQPSATIVRTSVFAAVGGFDPRLRYSEDNDMWRRIAWRHTISQMDEILMRYRFGHSNLMKQLTKRRWGRPLRELGYYLKIRRDTPDHMRHTVPPLLSFALPRLLIIVLPQWFHRPHPWLRPRTRWNHFKRMLRLRSRLDELRNRLKLRTGARA